MAQTPPSPARVPFVRLTKQKAREPSDIDYNGPVRGNKRSITVQPKHMHAVDESGVSGHFVGDFLDGFQMDLTQPLIMEVRRR